MIMPPRFPRTPAEILHGRPSAPPRPEAERVAALVRSGIRLAPSPNTGAAARDWAAHLAAGRIGVPAPAPPPPPGCDYRLASLECLLAAARTGRAA